MFDKAFAKWWLARVLPFSDVPPEKLAAEREAMARQQEYNQNYADFLKAAVSPGGRWTGQIAARENGVVHRVSAPGATSSRFACTWPGGGANWSSCRATRTAVTFEHHIITEGEKRGDDSAEDHTHQYDLRDPLPGAVAVQELQFFLGRMAQDLVEPPPQPESAADEPAKE